MLKKDNDSRSLNDNLKLGSLTAIAAGMVNVTSVIIFFSFTSNVTGHYAILAQEISKGNWYQAVVVFSWIALFFLGNFTSNLMLVMGNFRTRYLTHALPVLLEIICLLIVGIYLESFYQESLNETEFLVALMLFAMGLQNGLVAGISNSAVKTTHLTGLTTDLGLLFSSFVKIENRQNPHLINKAKLLLTIMFSYMAGGIVTGVMFIHLDSKVLFVACLVLVVVVAYDLYTLKHALNSQLASLRAVRRKEEHLLGEIKDNRQSA